MYGSELVWIFREIEAAEKEEREVKESPSSLGVYSLFDIRTMRGYEINEYVFLL
jgi:hypothetical protein